MFIRSNIVNTSAMVAFSVDFSKCHNINRGFSIPPIIIDISQVKTIAAVRNVLK